MSGMEALTLLLELPAYIENFAKVCRKIRDYKELDSSHKELMKRAILNSERLDHLGGLIRNLGEYSTVTQAYISHLVRQAKVAVDQTMTVVTDWEERLGIRDEVTGPRTSRLIPSFSDCFGSRKSAKSDIEEAKPSYFQERFAEAEYMITGKLAITSSMESLEHWLTDLNFAILTSDRLSVTPAHAQGTSVYIEFVARAKDKVAAESNINLIEAGVLEPLSDVDLEMGTGIYTVDSGPYSGCIVDPRNVMKYTGRNLDDIAWKETKNIARLFAEDTYAPGAGLSSSVGILPSCGYTALNTHLHAIVFRLPPDSAPPRTLRNILVEGKIRHSLHDRVQFAIRLATSVLVVHSLGLVHKAIKPDSIIVSERVIGDPKALYPFKLGIPYLLAFDSSRTSRGPTMREIYAFPGGDLWATLYKHPRHLGFRQYDYEMRDDIFSLGICLLEIALWKSLFIWDPDKKGFKDDMTVLDLSDNRCRAEALAQGKPKNTKRTWLRKYILIEAAKELIPPLMGDLFKDVVVACLTFGDVSELTKGEVFEPRINDESVLSPEDQSIRFVQDILAKLCNIRVS